MITERTKKSERLSKDELTEFKKIYKSYHTKTDAMEAFGTASYQVLDSLALKGSGSPKTIELVRRKLMDNNSK